jgi:hypothetical protein
VIVSSIEGSIGERERKRMRNVKEKGVWWSVTVSYRYLRRVFLNGPMGDDALFCMGLGGPNSFFGLVAQIISTLLGSHTPKFPTPNH